MHKEPIGAGVFSRATIAVEDVRDQAQALREVLFIYPETLTFDELARLMTVGSTQHIERDRVERAVRDLIAGGLFHPRTDDDVVRPTRAAINFCALMDV
jgi:hypothetical protein